MLVKPIYLLLLNRKMKLKFITDAVVLQNHLLAVVLGKCG
jgi:hypothetical protein